VSRVRVLALAIVTAASATAFAKDPVSSNSDPIPGESGRPTPVDPAERKPRDPANEPKQPAPPVAAPVPVTNAPEEKPITADDVRGAPVPGDESGRLDPVDTGDGTGRIIGRGLLAIPSIPIYIIAEPVRGVLYLKEKYNAVDVITNIFTTDDRKIALFPTALVETGFGLNIGARASMTDVLGFGEKVRARVGFGGQWNKLFDASVSTGEHHGLEIGLNFRYERKNNEQFFGLGNGDETDSPPPAPVDPNTNDFARSTRYQIGITRVAGHATYKFTRWLSATATTAFIRKNVDEDMDLSSGESPVGPNYDTTKLDGFGDPTEYLYTEGEIAYDSRHNGDIYDPPGMRTDGGLAAVFVGREGALEAGDRDFYRVGVDLQRIIRISGARALHLRAYGETVTVPREDIPFTELPVLGGYYLMRGYERDRFRDKSATVVQASYVWPLSMSFAGSLFVDAGRVFNGVEDFSVKDPRVGYGGALEMYGDKGLIIRAELASSIDGGIFGYVALDAAFDAQSRLGRR
jgi:hypothetical protein